MLAQTPKPEGPDQNQSDSLAGRDEESAANETATQVLGGSVLPPHRWRRASGDGPSSMPAALRAPLEAGFGQSFGGVRIHTGAEAARRTAQRDTAAVTIGDDVYFAPGQYRPAQPRGAAVLAHELAHTVQQRRSGVLHPAAWPGSPDVEPADRARRAIAREVRRLLTADRTQDLDTLQGSLDVFVAENHGDEATDTELDGIYDAIDNLSSISASVPTPEGADRLDITAAVSVLEWALGVPSEIGNLTPTMSLGVSAFIGSIADGVASLLTVPLGGAATEFIAEFQLFVSTWGDPTALMEFELSSTIDELVLLREEFNGAETTPERQLLGQQIGVVTRRALLLNDALYEVAGSFDAHVDAPDPLTRAVEEVVPIVERVRQQAADEDSTLGHFDDRLGMVRPQRVSLPGDDSDEEEAVSEVLRPEEMFPRTSDNMVEQFTSDLAERVTTQRDDVASARRRVLPGTSTTNFAEFLQTYGVWFQFYSPMGRDADKHYQMMHQLYSGLNQIALMVDEGAILQPFLVSGAASIMGQTIGTAQDDFGAAMPRMGRPTVLEGTAQSPSYSYAEIFAGTPRRRTEAGERSSRTSVVDAHRRITRRMTGGQIDAWTYLISTEQMDGSTTEEAKPLDPDIATYLLAQRQHRATLGRSHTPGVGDTGMAGHGVEAGRGVGVQTYVDGQRGARNRSVDSNQGTIDSAAHAEGFSTAEDGVRSREGSSVTVDLIRELVERLDGYFSEADVANRIAATAVISDYEYRSFQLIRNALTPESIALGLGFALGAKALQMAIVKLASRRLAGVLLGGLGRALTAYGGSDISRLAQLSTWMVMTSEVSSLHQARTMAYSGQYAADALGNLLQSAVVSGTMSTGALGINAVKGYVGTAAPRTVRELANTLAPITQDPAAKAEVLSAIRQEIAQLEATTAHNESNSDLMVLRTLENEMLGRSGEHDAADVTLAHDQRTPEERLRDALDEAGVAQSSERAFFEEAFARNNAEQAPVHEGQASRVVGDPNLTQALGVPGVQAAKTSAEGRGVRVHYTTRKLLGIDIVDSIHVEAGRDARPSDMANHRATAQRLLQLQGVSGACRRVWGRMNSVWGSMPPEINRPGTLGFEAHLEIQKLPKVIADRVAELDAFNRANPEAALGSERGARLEAQIRHLEQQLAQYEMIVRDLESVALTGRGFIAASEVHPIPRGGVSVQSRIDAGHRPPRYTRGREHLFYFKDGHYQYRPGAQRGSAQAPRLRPGQAFDPNLRRPRLSDFSSTVRLRPLDRHDGVRTIPEARVSVWRERLPSRVPDRAAVEADMTATMTPAERRALGHRVEEAVVSDHGTRGSSGSAIRVRHEAGDRLRIGDVARYEVTVEGQSGRMSDNKLDQIWRDLVAYDTVHLIVPNLSPAAATQLRQLAATFEHVTGRRPAIAVREVLPPPLPSAPVPAAAP